MSEQPDIENTQADLEAAQCNVEVAQLSDAVHSSPRRSAIEEIA